MNSQKLTKYQTQNQQSEIQQHFLAKIMMVNQMPAIKDGQSVMAIGVEKSE